ncbi:MAG: sigma-70 family RNA polymerase sigma factor [Gemmatimonadota bacterium]|nr:sigma-70 family RNA polymerase sigma factor [Gemmatimonadota bacterium]
MDPPPTDEQIATDSTDFTTAVTEAVLAVAFWERLRLFAARRLGDARLAEDVAQETLHRVIHSVRTGRLRTPDALPAFVFATAKHICQHRERSSQREERALLRFGSDLLAVSAPPDALAELVGAERRAMVRRALSRLGESDRRLLRALFFEQRDPGEVARELGSTPGALRVRKHRALQRLAELVNGTDE